MKTVGYFIIVLLLFCSCARIYGIKDVKPVSLLEMDEFYNKNKIKADYKYITDSVLYPKYCEIFLKTDSFILKDMRQPLQLRAFNIEGKLVAFTVNCYLSGFPKLNWNHNGVLDKFPPKVIIRDIPEHTFEKELQLLQAPNLQIDTEKFDLIIVAYWALFMEKQSKHFLKEINNYTEKFSDKRILTICVNADNLFLN
jgi:hypothetical protein